MYKEWIKNYIFGIGKTSYINSLYLVSLANSTLYLPIFQRLCGGTDGGIGIGCYVVEWREERNEMRSGLARASIVRARVRV